VPQEISRKADNILKGDREVAFFLYGTLSTHAVFNDDKGENNIPRNDGFIKVALLKLVY
jgi:hypothetical protein